MSMSKSVDLEWKSLSASWRHKSSCYDNEGRLECCCSLRKSLNLYNQSVAEVGLTDRSEET